MSDKIVCFHNPDEENGYLSNWHPSKFQVWFPDGMEEFSSMEQYMMYSKAELFQDEDAMHRIMNTDDVAEIKRIGRKVKGYNDIVWNGLRQMIVHDGIMAKFSQNQKLHNLLVSTGDSILAECAVKDTIWGIGLSMHDPDRFDINKWKGQNLLGFTLMYVRSTL